MKVTITFEGVEKVLSNLTDIGEKAGENLQKQIEELGKDTAIKWQQATPSRSNRLRGSDKMMPGELSFTLQNAVYYYKFVDEGHMTPKAFHGRPARRISHVQGREMTKVAVDFIMENLIDYLAKFLDF